MISSGKAEDKRAKKEGKRPVGSKGGREEEDSEGLRAKRGRTER